MSSRDLSPPPITPALIEALRREARAAAAQVRARVALAAGPAFDAGGVEALTLTTLTVMLAQAEAAVLGPDPGEPRLCRTVQGVMQRLADHIILELDLLEAPAAAGSEAVH